MTQGGGFKNQTRIPEVNQWIDENLKKSLVSNGNQFTNKVLRDNLKHSFSRAGLSVDIFKFPPADGAPKTEFIFFGDASSSMDLRLLENL